MRYQEEPRYTQHQADGMSHYHAGADSEAARQFLAALHDAHHLHITDERLAVTLYQLAEIALTAGRFHDAEKYFQEALTTEEHGLGPDHPYIAVIPRAYAALLQRQGRFNEAACLTARAEDIWEGTVLAPAPACAI